MFLSEVVKLISAVWSKWKTENPRLTDPTVVNNGYCVEFALDVGQAIPNVKYWSNFKKRFEHVFVEYNGKFYDAECLSGVTDYRQLPIWDRISMVHDVSIEDITKYCRQVSLRQLCKQYGFNYPPTKT